MTLHGGEEQYFFSMNLFISQTILLWGIYSITDMDNNYVIVSFTGRTREAKSQNNFRKTHS